MTGTGLLIAVGYAVLVAVGALAAVWVWSSTRRPRDVETGRLAERESRWAVVVLAVLTALLVGTIFFTPYGEGAGGGQRVQVEASQFAWQVTPAAVRAGEPVTFELTAADVNHAMGIYDEDGTLVVQVQAMPGETQLTVHTFEDAGVYEILCLEFCGIGHHLMATTIEVTE